MTVQAVSSEVPSIVSKTVLSKMIVFFSIPDNDREQGLMPF